MSSVDIKARVAIIGLGLIGGSIAQGLQRQGCHICAYDIDQDALKIGLEMGVIDARVDALEDLVDTVEFIIIAIPVLAMIDLMPSLKHCFDNNKIAITDVGSVKSEVHSALIKAFGHVPANFVLGHPIAGSEKHGVRASNGSLFQNHKVILTPLEHTDKTVLEKVTQLWTSLGAEVSHMDSLQHDQLLAQTSHLPHLLAYALIDTLSRQGNSLDIFDFAAGGLRDFSRIAASDPTMWRDVFLANREPLLEILNRYQADLKELQSLIANNQSEALFKTLTRSKNARDHFSQILIDREN